LKCLVYKNIFLKYKSLRYVVKCPNYYFRNFHAKSFGKKNNEIKSGAHILQSKGFITGFVSIGVFVTYTLWRIKYQKFLPNVYNSNILEVSSSDTSTLVGHRSKYNFIADVVEVCAPAVVYIEIKDTKRFDYFTGQPFTASNGSGFIIESDGLVLTNAHVVINKPHTMVQVKLKDGRTFPGSVEDVDQTSDLATVRIQCKNLPKMKLGESNSLRSGEWVVAMGSPLALSNTVTAGVVSSTQRASHELGLRGRDINYVQTDAAITFGNSGGPLVNLNGEVIGINSMKVTAGISFAIPIDYAKSFLKRSEERRKKGGLSNSLNISRRYMGITMLTLTNDILLELKHRSDTVPNDITHGVLVWKVIFGSPAHQGGLSPGDIVTEINGKEIHNSSDIYDVLAEKEKILNMTIYRGLNRMKIEIKPEDP